MVRDRTVGLLLDAWDDFDRALAGLEPAQMVAQPPGQSSFAWTAAHVANQVDAWVNVRFQQREPHALVGQTRFRMGGSGEADDWEAIAAAVAEVRAAARAYLEPLAPADLELTIPYDGSLAHLRERGLNLRYAVLRACAHHYFHTGEIAAVRARLGQHAGDYPGRLEHTM